MLSAHLLLSAPARRERTGSTAKPNLHGPFGFRCERPSTPADASPPLACRTRRPLVIFRSHGTCTGTAFARLARHNEKESRSVCMSMADIGLQEVSPPISAAAHDELLVPFTQGRREITRRLHDLREQIRIRNLQVRQQNETPETAALSHRIRTELRNLRIKLGELRRELQRLEQSHLDSGELRRCREMVLMLEGHIQQAEAFDAQQYTAPSENMRILLPVPRVQALSPDLGEVPIEIAQSLQDLDAQEAEMNAELDRMLISVNQVGEMAQSMRGELQKQDQTLTTMHDTTDRSQSKLQRITAKAMRLAGIERCGLERVIVYAVLLIILALLGIGMWRLIVTRRA